MASGNERALRAAMNRRDHGFPVPAVRFAGEDDEWFDTAYILFEVFDAYLSRF